MPLLSTQTLTTRFCLVEMEKVVVLIGIISNIKPVNLSTKLTESLITRLHLNIRSVH